MMRRHQFHTIDESIQFLAEKHDITRFPNRSLRLKTQRRQRIFIEPMLKYQNDDPHYHAKTEQQKDSGYSSHTYVVFILVCVWRMWVRVRVYGDNLYHMSNAKGKQQQQQQQ